MRQACNVAYAVLSENRNEDQQEELDIALGMIEDPDAQALELLAAYQESIGKTAVDPHQLAQLKPPREDEKL